MPMIPAISIAASGLAAASARLQASASNIANQASRGAPGGGAPKAYTPVNVVQTAQPGAGVSARIQPAATPPVIEYDPDAPFADAEGRVASPAIDIARQFVDQMLSQRAFEANLKVIRSADEMTRSLIDRSA